MSATLIFVVFVALMLLGVPIGVALMLGGAVGIGLAELGWLAIPNNFYAGVAKYPLLALPMFVLVGVIFERSGVARRLVEFATAVVGRGPGMLPMIAILVAMFLGGISGSGPATAAAVGGVMLVAMARAGSTDSNVYKEKILEIANGPADGSGVKILPGELGKALELIAAGTAIDYDGASGVTLIGPGESAGRYRQFEVKGGKYETVQYR